MLWVIGFFIGLIVFVGLFMAFGLSIIFAGFTAYMGYIGASELGTNSEFIKLFGGMIGFFIGLAMGKFVRKMLVGELE
jgi:hypothetical protein